MKEFELIRLLVEEDSTNKTSNGRESSVEASCEQHRVADNIPPTPPPPPEGDADADDMGNDTSHIPLYEGD